MWPGFNRLPCGGLPFSFLLTLTSSAKGMDQLPPSFHPETCSKQGLITVGNTKDKIYFELHDSPACGVEASTPDRVLLICGWSLPAVPLRTKG